MATWHDIDTVLEEDEHGRLLWPDAESINEDLLQSLLEVAKVQVTAYAPKIADPANIPTHVQLAQLRQAQNLYNAGRVDASGGIGDGSDFIMRPHPLDWHIKAMLRPRRGVPSVR